jgi:hypothetical protein
MENIKQSLSLSNVLIALGQLTVHSNVIPNRADRYRSPVKLDKHSEDLTRLAKVLVAAG